MLGARRRRGREPLELVGGHRALPGFLQRRSGRRIALSRLEPAEHGQRRALTDAELVAERQRSARVGLRRPPLAASQAQHRADAEQVLHVAVELALGGEGQRALDVGVDARVIAPAHQRPRREIDQRTRSVVVLPHARREHEGLLEQRPPALAVGPAEQHRADVRQSVGDDLGIVELARQPHGPRPERNRLLDALAVHRQLGAPAQRPRQLAAVGEGLEHGDRLVADRRRLGAAARPPQHAREPAQVVAGAQRVARGLVDRQQFAAGLDRALGAPAQVGLDGDALERLRVAGGERGLPVLERLAVTVRGGGGAGRGGREPADRLRVAGPAGVVHEPRRVGVAEALERLEHAAVELALADRRDLVGDGAADEVVAEDQGVAAQGQQPGGDALVDRLACGGHQRQLDARRHDGGELDDRARRRAQRVDAHRHRVAHAGRDHAVGRGQRLGDEERVAARNRVQVRGLAPRAPRQLGDGSRRERGGRDPPQAFARQRAEHAPHVIAAGQDQAAR